jgi:hypothetical protein
VPVQGCWPHAPRAQSRLCTFEPKRIVPVTARGAYAAGSSACVCLENCVAAQRQRGHTVLRVKPFVYRLPRLRIKVK